MQRLRARVFTSAEGQAVLLPEGLRIDAEEVEIWRNGEKFIIRPVKPAAFASWGEMFAAIDRRRPDLAIEDRNQPPQPENRVSFDDD